MICRTNETTANCIIIRRFCPYLTTRSPHIEKNKSKSRQRSHARCQPSGINGVVDERSSLDRSSSRLEGDAQGSSHAAGSLLRSPRRNAIQPTITWQKCFIANLTTQQPPTPERHPPVPQTWLVGSPPGSCRCQSRASTSASRSHPALPASSSFVTA